MKILYYSPHPALNLTNPAGYGSHMRGTISAMETLGHEVKLIINGGVNKEVSLKQGHSAPSALAKLLPSIIKETIKDIRLLLFDCREKKKLQQIVQQFQPDIIYERSAYLMSAGVKVAREFGITHYLEVNAPFIQEKKEMEGHSLLIGRAAQTEAFKMQVSNKLIVVSHALKDFCQQEHNLSVEKIAVAPNGINLSDWHTDFASAKQISMQLGFDKDNFVVGFVGSILPHHGVERLISSFAKVARTNWRLLIVGDGWPLESLKQQAIESGVAHQTIFTGNIPFEQIKNYMSLFSVAVMPQSNWYGSPVKIFEYGAVGKPVIAPDVGPVKDVMQSDDAILIDDDVELANALLLLANNKDKANALAHNWRKKVANNYTWLAITEKLLSC